MLGLMSSLHCIGMCGPIALVLPLRRDRPVRRAFGIGLYHLGRIASYAALGLLFGGLGRGFYLAGLQQKMSLLAGVAMLALVIAGERRISRFFGARWTFGLSQVKRRLGLQLKRPGLSSVFLMGVFNGLLPCGLVYAALFGAIATQHAIGGGFYMALFGVGTAPLLTAVVYGWDFATPYFRNKAQLALPYLLAGVALLFIVRGLGLGIPYLSPSSLNLVIRPEANCHP